MIEYLEKAAVFEDYEVWTVRVDGEIHTAQIFNPEHREHIEQLATMAADWLGFSHPHALPILSVTNNVIVTGDERGPKLLQVAEQLTDANDRTTWATAQVAGIAEAIAMMQWRQPSFIHRRANTDSTVVGPDGIARLKAPVAHIGVGERKNYMGAGKVIGSPEWLSPEQARGVPATRANDVYTLAAMLYGAITGKPPFHGDGESFMSLILAIIQGPLPEPPATSPALRDHIMRNLERDPTKRDPDPATFAATLGKLSPEPSPDLLAKVAALRLPREPVAEQLNLIIGKRCHKRWNDLAPTATEGVRNCTECKLDVVNARTLEQVIPLLGRSCFAYEPD